MGLHWIKVFFAITLIATTKTITEIYRTEIFITNLGLNIIFWISIFVFLDWKDWVTRPFVKGEDREGETAKGRKN